MFDRILNTPAEPKEAVCQVFCKKGVPNNFGKLIGKHLCQSLFLIKFQVLLQRDSGAGEPL